MSTLSLASMYHSTAPQTESIFTFPPAGPGEPGSPGGPGGPYSSKHKTESVFTIPSNKHQQHLKAEQ